MGGCQEAIPTLNQWQRVFWRDESSPEPGPQSLKQCGIISTENETKGSQHPKKSFGISFKEPGELFLKTP